MLSNNEIKQWKEKGYLVKNNILPKKIIDLAVEFMNNKYNKNNLPHGDFGSKNHELEFPSNTIFDSITVHKNIINCVQQLLNTNDILLTQSDAWSKCYTNFNPQSNLDQRIHMDFGNHTFLHIGEWENPEVVAIILYLSDIEETGGGTAYVPRNGPNDYAYKLPYINMPGQNKFNFYNDKTTAENYFKNNFKKIYKFREDLYKREKIVNAKPGDILFYRLDLWHRGTPIKKNKIRHVMNLAYKKKECHWINIWNSSWTKKMYYGWLEKFITSISPLQRSVLGFPLPGDSYWNKKNIKLLKNRYPNMKIQPYLSKL